MAMLGYYAELKDMLMHSLDPQMLLLLYFVLPVWLIAGFADWLCHRATEIEHTSGVKETWIHILMFLEMGTPLLLALFTQLAHLLSAITLREIIRK